MKTLFSQRLSVIFAACLILVAASFAYADSTSIGGVGMPFDSMQPSLAMNYLISTTGVFPSPGGNLPNQQFLGEVVPYAGTLVPQGWMPANGQLLSISQNQALFAVIGNNYGGDGKSTFALPDLRGRSVVGVGQGPGLVDRVLGSQAGAAQTTLLDSQIPAHAHSLPGGGITGANGGGQPFSNLKPTLAMNYDIHLDGVFPSSSGSAITQVPFVGQVSIFAGNYGFENFLGANGQLLSVDQNQILFTVIGTTFGGDGANTFALPDLRGRTPIGAGHGTGLANRNISDLVGHDQTTLTLGQLPEHVHNLPGGGATGITGGTQPIDNMGPSLALTYMIAVQGTFPSPIGGVTEPFLGEIGLFAGNFAPTGWLPADGRLLSISQNQLLFSVLGTTYGGNSVTTFALPDLRGRSIIGAGQGAGLPNWTLGQTAGFESVAFTGNQLPPHAHTLPVPEPSGFAMILLGASCLAAVLIRKRETRRRHPRW
jgi:microcystin-dependent protein